MTDNTEIRFSEAELDAIADRICKRIMFNLSPENHYSQHLWVADKQQAEMRSKVSVRRVLEAVIGSISIMTLVGIATWVGHEVMIAMRVGK